MNFTIPAKAINLLTSPSKSSDPTWSFKLGQQLDAKVLQMSLEKNIIELQLGQTTVKVSPEPALSSQKTLPLSQFQFKKGQQLQLLVTKLIPTPELTLKSSTQMLSKQLQIPLTAESQQPHVNEIKSKAISLKLFPATAELPSNAKTSLTEKITSLPKGYQITARVISANNKTLTLELPSELKTPQSNAPKALKPTLLSLAINKLSAQTAMEKTNLPLIKTGQFVLLEVTKTGKEPQFKILQKLLPSAAQEKVVTDAMKRFLPIQDSPENFVSQIHKNLSSLQEHKSVPEALKKLAQQILQNLPKKTTLTEAQGLKQSIKHSGLFLESSLANTEKVSQLNPQADFKANTLKFIQILKQLLPLPSALELNDSSQDPVDLKQLQNHAESSVAKMVLDQLNSLPKEESPKQVWNLEIPYIEQKNIENISIQIEQNKNQPGAQEHDNWSVTLTLSPPGLGELQCKISCSHGTIGTHFWSNSTTTTQLISQNLDYLKSRMEASGLKTGQIKAHGQASESIKDTSKYNQILIDEQI